MKPGGTVSAVRALVRMTARSFSSCLPVFGRLFVIVVSFAVAAVANPFELDLPRAVRIPYLPWQQRKDWLSVKAFGAIGDGIADDTAAIQATILNATKVLSFRSDSSRWHPRPVYFPEGRYRITRTLVSNLTYGAAWVGTGRASVLSWDGPHNSSMFWSNGNTRCRYEGLVFDGNFVPGGVGIDHDAQATIYETRIHYRNMLFMRWSTAGIRVGRKQDIPSAEVRRLAGTPGARPHFCLLDLPCDEPAASRAAACCCAIAAAHADVD